MYLFELAIFAGKHKWELNKGKFCPYSIPICVWILLGSFFNTLMFPSTGISRVIGLQFLIE